MPSSRSSVLGNRACIFESSPLRWYSLHAIKQYFLEHRNEEIGDLQAGFLLEFCLKEIGPAIYNKGVQDAQTHMGRVVEDLDYHP